MPVNPQFFINNQLSAPARNWQELIIELNFDKENQVKQTTSITDLELVRENGLLIDNYVKNGAIGGVGVFEGIPLKILLQRNSFIENIFNGYIDLTQRPQISKNISTVKLVEKKNIDWLRKVADGVTFEYLESIGKISKTTDYVYVPYVLNSIPNYKEAGIMLISVYTIASQIVEKITQISMLVTEMTNPFEATAIVRMVLYVVYLTAYLIALVKLIKDLMNVLIQKIKYHAGMYTKTLLTKGAEHFGFTFRSSIFENDVYKDEVIIPEKYNVPQDENEGGIMGWFQPNQTEMQGVYRGTFGDLLEAQSKKHNARVVILGNELWLLKENETNGAPTYILPPVKQPFYSINADEFKAQTYIDFQTDLSEANTIDQYVGTSVQVFRQPVTYNDAGLLLMGGIELINIPFALAKIKTDLSLPEKIIKGFLDGFSFLMNGLIKGVNGAINIFNRVTRIINKVIKALDVVGINVNWEIKPIRKLEKIDLGAVIENRLGMMVLENDYFQVAKVLILSVGTEPKFNKPHALNSTWLSAKYIYDNFYLQSSFTPNSFKSNGNQYYIKELNDVPFGFDDFQKVKNNNFVLTANGEEARIESCKWNVYNQHADITVRINKLYTNNITETFLIPTGV